MKLLSLLLASLPMMAAAQSQQHLVAYAQYSGNSFDSTRYTYLSHNPAYLPVTENWNNDQSSSYTKDGREVRRETRKFDGSGRITELTKKRLDANSTWIDDEQLLYTYDGNGNIATHEVWIYSSTTNELGKYARYEYSYDAGGNLQEYIRYNVQNVSGLPTFVPGVRETYSYTGNQLTQTLLEHYVSGTWKIVGRTINTYPTATTAEELSESYDGASWSPQSRILKTLDANQRVLRSVLQVHNGTTWEDHSSENYTYNGAGKWLTHERKKWTGGVETGDFLSELTYNSDNHIASGTGKTWSDTAYTVTSRSYYYYAFPTGVANATTIKDGMQVYPIPASNNIYIALQAQTNQQYKAVLYNATGRMAKTVHGMAIAGGQATSINVQDLPAGNYVLHVQAGSTVSTQKVVIAR